jgi:hypothetical protein
MWTELQPSLPMLAELRLFETDEFAVIYRGK